MAFMNQEIGLKLLGQRKGSNLAIVRTRSFTAVKFCYVLLKPVIFTRTQVICGVICVLYKVISQFFIVHNYSATIVSI